MENEMEREFTVTWIIKYYFISCMQNKVIGSPSFEPNYSSNDEWSVILCRECDSIRCTLRKMKSGEIRVGEIKNEFEMEVTDKDDNICYSKLFKNLQAVRNSNARLVGEVNFDVDKLITGTETMSLTVRCHFLSNAKSRMPKRECIIRTAIASERYSFEWKVKLQDAIQKRNIQYQGVKFEMSLHKNNFVIKRQGNPYISWFEVLCSLLDIAGNQKETKKEVYCIKESEVLLQFQTSLSEEKLKESNCLENGIFTLKCEICAFLGSHFSDIEYIYAKQEDIPPIKDQSSSGAESLKSSGVLQRVYGARMFNDVEFRIDNEVLYAHKCVLSVLSPVFLAMFSQEMKEKQTGVVDIIDSDSKTFDTFLKYFYCGTVDNLDYQMAINMIKLADKYQVQPLVSMCSPVLASNISEATAIEILLTADVVQNSDLKKMAISFIKERAADIMNSDQWEGFVKDNIKLVTEIITYGT